MNRISTAVTALGLAATVTLAATNEVVSVNVVGYAKVNVPAQKYVLASIGFNAMDPNATVQELFGDQLTGGFGFADGDHIYMWDAAQQKYILLYKQSTGGVFPNDGWLNGETLEPATNKVTPGMAFWLESVQVADQTVTMLGEVVSAATMPVALVEGFNFVSYPYSADQALTNTTMQADGAVGGFGYADSDHLYSWDVANQKYEIFYLQNSGGIFPNDGWINGESLEPATKVLALAEGYWYERLAGNGVLTWSPTIPYTL